MPDLANHLGEWNGTWSTYLTPEELFDESPLSATIAADGDDFHITYKGTIEGNEVSGRLKWVDAGDQTTVDWMDPWHTAGQEERLEGSPPSFQYGDDDPWTWDITIEADESGVRITHHNAGPGIPRYIGVSMNLTERVAA